MKVADAMLLLQRWRAVWAERLETIDHLVQLAHRAGCRLMSSSHDATSATMTRADARHSHSDAGAPSRSISGTAAASSTTRRSSVSHPSTGAIERDSHSVAPGSWRSEWLQQRSHGRIIGSQLPDHSYVGSWHRGRGGHALRKRHHEQTHRTAAKRLPCDRHGSCTHPTAQRASRCTS